MDRWYDNMDKKQQYELKNVHNSPVKVIKPTPFKQVKAFEFLVFLTLKMTA